MLATLLAAVTLVSAASVEIDRTLWDGWRFRVVRARRELRLTVRTGATAPRPMPARPICS